MKIHKAETATSLLIALLLFSLICLGWLGWQSQQTMQSQFVFQQQQALQIAENQIARLLAKLPCQKRWIQNGVQFDIHRCSEQEIEVKFPLGEIVILNKNVQK